MLPAYIIAAPIDDMPPSPPRLNVHAEWLSVVTVNAQTLKARAKRDQWTAQFRHMRTHVIGIQEVRLRKQSFQTSGGFIVVRSAADCSGNYGCEVWFSTVLPFVIVRDRPCKFREANVTVLLSQPRRLVVL